MIVDASVAVKWFIEEPGTDRARALIQSGQSLLAPDLVLAEIGNTFWKLVRRGEVEPALVSSILQTAAEAFTELAAIDTLAGRALELAMELDHPVYDCLYLALAERSDDRVITADRRFLAVLEGTERARLAVLL